jgi:hypothetical protein
LQGASDLWRGKTPDARPGRGLGHRADRERPGNRLERLDADRNTDHGVTAPDAARPSSSRGPASGSSTNGRLRCPARTASYPGSTRSSDSRSALGRCDNVLCADVPDLDLFPISRSSIWRRISGMKIYLLQSGAPVPWTSSSATAGEALDVARERVSIRQHAAKSVIRRWRGLTCRRNPQFCWSDQGWTIVDPILRASDDYIE